jgi:hypothetical protein
MPYRYPILGKSSTARHAYQWLALLTPTRTDTSPPQRQRVPFLTAMSPNISQWLPHFDKALQLIPVNYLIRLNLAVAFEISRSQLAKGSSPSKQTLHAADVGIEHQCPNAVMPYSLDSSTTSPTSAAQCDDSYKFHSSMVPTGGLV